MASPLLPPVKAETLSTPPPSESTLMKHEQPDVSNAYIIDTPPPLHLVNSIDELRSLSTALSTFLRRYDELHDHLNSIKTAIDSKLPPHLLTNPNPNSNPNQLMGDPLPETSTPAAKTLEPEANIAKQNPNVIATDCAQNHEISKKPETTVSKKAKATNASKKAEAANASKKAEANNASKKAEAINASKEAEATDASKKAVATKVSKKPKETDVSKKAKDADVLKKPKDADIPKKPKDADVSKKPEETDVSKRCEETDGSKSKEMDVSKQADVSELQRLCEAMNGRGVKRYIVMHISDLNILREEVPKALKLAKDPAKLVLEGVGRFFVQGSRAFSKGSREILVRLGSVVLLECFLMMSSDIEIAKAEEEYAAKAAVDWRKRMIHEGGLTKVGEADARGLLLLISSFGIPSVFKNEDIRELIRASNVKEISTALRRSIVLIPKIPEIIDWMVKNNMEIKAVDIAYTFGLEDKCPPRTILTTFLRNEIKDKQHGSSTQAKNAIKKQLADLKSITECLNAHKIDPSKLLPDFKINETISCLEKEMKELNSKADDEKPAGKRKAKEAEPSRKPKQQEPKRTRLSEHNNAPQEPETVDNGYGKSPYGQPTPPNHYFDGRPLSDYINPYPHRSEDITSSLPIGSSSVMLSGSYGGGGGYGSTVTDQMVRSNGQPYNWHDETDLVQKYLGQTYSRQMPSYNSQPSITPGLIGLYNRPPTSSLEAFPGHGLTPGMGVSGQGGGPVSDLYGFAGGPGMGVSGRGSDLYGFADSVMERESYGGTADGPRASGSGTMRSSYL